MNKATGSKLLLLGLVAGIACAPELLINYDTLEAYNNKNLWSYEKVIEDSSMQLYGEDIHGNTLHLFQLNRNHYNFK